MFKAFFPLITLFSLNVLAGESPVTVDKGNIALEVKDPHVLFDTLIGSGQGLQNGKLIAYGERDLSQAYCQARQIIFFPTKYAMVGSYHVVNYASTGRMEISVGDGDMEPTQLVLNCSGATTMRVQDVKKALSPVVEILD